MAPEEFQTITGLGEIPSDWQIEAADDLSLKITKGTTPPGADVSREGRIPFLRVNNLSFNGALDSSSELIFVSKKVHEGFLARSKAYPGDILMNIVGPPLGKTALLEETYLEFNMNQAIVLFRLKNNLIDARYFLAFLNSANAQHWLQSRSKKTSGQQNLTIELCKKLPVPLPAIPEQREIAKILSTWNGAIAATERLLDNSEQQKKALMQQLLTGKKRLPGFEGEWRVVRLKELLGEEKERNKSGSISRVLSVSNKYGFVLPESHFSKKVASDDLTNYKVVRKGQFGYNPSRLNVGSFARLDSYDDGVLSPMYVIFSVDDQKLNSDYFLAWMASNEASQRISSSTQGTVRDSVGFDALCSLPFRLPPLQEQDAIVNVISACDSLIAKYQISLDFLREEKKALMQQLLTGKSRVKN